MTVSAYREMEYRDLLLVPSAGYVLRSVEGLMGAPEVRTADLPLTARDGVLLGTDFLGVRTITVTLEVVATTPEDFSTAASALAAVLRPAQGEAPLSFMLRGVAGGSPARINARVLQWAAPVDDLWEAQAGTFVVQFVATDPRIYALDETTVSTTLPELNATGMTFNVTPDIIFGALTGGGNLNITNGGSAPAPARIRFIGPLTNPRIRHAGQDRTLGLSMEIATGDSVVIDTAARTVVLNNQASRYSFLTSPEWFLLDPGLNQLEFRADAQTAGTVEVTYADTWI